MFYASIIIRCICLAWIIINSLITGYKKKVLSTLNEVFSLQTVYSLYFSVMIMIMQIISIHYSILLVSDLPFSLDQLNDPGIIDTFWMVRGLAFYFKQVEFIDTICIFFCWANLILLSRNFFTSID